MDNESREKLVIHGRRGRVGTGKHIFKKVSAGFVSRSIKNLHSGKVRPFQGP
jgi:hypothetical protein